jgi:hypothetical protein
VVGAGERQDDVLAGELCRRHHVDGCIIEGIDRDGDAIGVLTSATVAAVAEVVGDHRDDRRPDEIGRRHEAQIVEGGVEGAQRSAEDHGGIIDRQLAGVLQRLWFSSEDPDGRIREGSSRGADSTNAANR